MRHKCSRCRKTKDSSKFCRNVKSGHTYYCKECQAIMRKEYKKQNPWMLTLSNVIQRCNNPINNVYHKYGAKGITCDLSVEQIKEIWIESGASYMRSPVIHRENNSIGYTAGNCSFIEKKDHDAYHTGVRAKARQEALCQK
jgi:hypothetical protein